MSETKDPEPAGQGEEERDRAEDQRDGAERDEADREGIARDDQLEHAIDED